MPLHTALNESYQYDGLDRLKQADRTSWQQQWGLSATGNWASFNDNGAGQTRTHNLANETQTISNWVNPTHDAAGNMTLAPRPGDETTTAEALTMVWDAWNRLRSVSKNDATAASPVGIGDAEDTPATLIAEYEYDGIHRRIRKTVYVMPEKAGDPKAGELVNALDEPAVDFVLDFYYLSSKAGVPNDWQVCEVRKTVGETTHPYKQYVWGIRYVHAAICRFRDTNFDGTLDENVYYTQDANYNATSLVAAAGGAVIERYHYDPYGKTSVYDGSWNSRTASLYDNVVLFTGHKLDAETGLYHGKANPIVSRTIEIRGDQPATVSRPG
jgi:hypothetical protein